MRTFYVGSDLVSVDDEDYEKLQLYSWSRHKKSIVTNVKIGERSYKEVPIQNVIMNHWGNNGQTVIDHKDRNRLNNQKFNLRIATAQQNSWNRNRQSTNRFDFKGVKLSKHGRWEARIIHNGKYTHLGTFDDPETAAKAYDKEAVRLFGEFACTNRSIGTLSDEHGGGVL